MLIAHPVTQHLAARRVLAVVGLVIALLCTGLARGTSSAWADGWWSGVVCDQGTTAGCTASAGTNGSDGTDGTAGTSRSGKDDDRAGPAKQRTCRDVAYQPMPCESDLYGSAGDDGCYYKATTVTPDQAAAFGGAGKGPGGWFEQSCFGTPGTGGGLVWRPGTAAQPRPVDPAVLARQAADRLTLASPAIRANPSPQGEQLVSLPTWLWVAADGWREQQATATVPGVTVTASATPTKVTWSMGDGSTEVCDGPGQAFPAGADPRTPSPSCGHTFTVSSAGQPGDAFTVEASIAWRITWAGGGRTGQLPDLETTSRTTFRVAESQALTLGSGAA